MNLAVHLKIERMMKHVNDNCDSSYSLVDSRDSDCVHDGRVHTYSARSCSYYDFAEAYQRQERIIAERDSRVGNHS